MDEEEAGRLAGWMAGRQGKARVVHKGDGNGTEEGRGRERPSGLESSIARIFAVMSRKSCDRPLVYCTSTLCRVSNTPPHSSCFRATVRLRFYPSFFARRNDGKLTCTWLFLSSLFLLFISKEYLIPYCISTTLLLSNSS